MSIFVPTEEQDRVINANPREQLLVLAGAGTGKTEALVRRLEYLLDCPGIEHGSVLLLSFSRAAVCELKGRLSNRESDARFVRARTFDSFATRLLMNAPADGEIASLGYDDRIRLATSLIPSNEIICNILADYRHIVVDEMQDLVGDRQLFVKALISHIVDLGGGFTLFSDPAQSIFDWQVEGTNSRIISSEMLAWLRMAFRSTLKEVSFLRDHRFETEEAKVALWARQELISSAPTYDKIYSGLRGNLHTLPTFRLQDRVAGLRRSKEKVAILTRTNAHALLLSTQLAKAGIAHSVQRDQSDRCVAPWLAVVLRGWSSPQMSKSSFIERCEAIIPRLRPPDPESCWWLLLKRVDRSGGKMLNLPRVSSALAVGDCPDELVQQADGSLTVSTIHRAKGLQFDVVMISDPSDDHRDFDAKDASEEARVLYVALTRARRSLERLDDPRGCRLGRDRNGRMRLYRYAKASNFPIVVAFEVTVADTDSIEPAGAFGTGCSVLATQRYIEKTVNIGDPVSARLLKCRDDSCGDEMHYVIMHNESPVAVTSLKAFLQYSEALRSPKAFGRYEIRWPQSLRGMRVEGIETVAGSTATGVKHGLGSCGLWLRVRVSGVVDWEYERNLSDES